MSKLIQRYRRANTIKATKPFSLLFSVRSSDVMADLTDGRP